MKTTTKYVESTKKAKATFRSVFCLFHPNQRTYCLARGVRPPRCEIALPQLFGPFSNGTSSEESREARHPAVAVRGILRETRAPFFFFPCSLFFFTRYPFFMKSFIIFLFVKKDENILLYTVSVRFCEGAEQGFGHARRKTCNCLRIK